jgi:hypothetical protein
VKEPPVVSSSGGFAFRHPKTRAAQAEYNRGRRIIALQGGNNENSLHYRFVIAG